MSTFRFAIMGAGNIAHQFCDAVTLVEDCEVSAIASKDLGRAQKFAEECSVAHAYDNYEQMLIEEKPDCSIWMRKIKDAETASRRRRM